MSAQPKVEQTGCLLVGFHRIAFIFDLRGGEVELENGCQPGCQQWNPQAVTPSNPPMAKPPPRIFPRQTRSGRMPKYSAAPPKAILKLVTTSSKIRTTPVSVVTWRKALRNSISAGTTPRPNAETGS